MKQCFKMPKFLFASKYKCVRVNAKMLYMILYSRLLDILEKADDGNSISFRDRNGVFIIVSCHQLADFFGFHLHSIYSLLSELSVSGLIDKRFVEKGDGEVKIYFNL